MGYEGGGGFFSAPDATHEPPFIWKTSAAAAIAPLHDGTKFYHGRCGPWLIMVVMLKMGRPCIPLCLWLIKIVHALLC